MCHCSIQRRSTQGRTYSSVRPDFIPVEYTTALSTLQDQVPSFPTANSQTILKQGLGPTVLSELEGLEATAIPVALESIGQVYRASVCGTGKKLQSRSNILVLSAILRWICILFKNWHLFIKSIMSNLRLTCKDWPMNAGEGRRGFIGELDSCKESQCAIMF
jgi:hypothetical protein